MRKETKPSPTESPLLFAIDPEPLTEKRTALGGIPLVVQAFRALGLPESVRQQVQIKQRERGYDEHTFVESFVILNAAGGPTRSWLEGDIRTRAAFADRGTAVSELPCCDPAKRVQRQIVEVERLANNLP